MIQNWVKRYLKKNWPTIPPTITVKTTGKRIPSKEGYIWDSFLLSGSKKVIMKINNPKKISIYYRWVMYNGYNMTDNKISIYDNCVATTSSPEIIKTMGLSKSFPERRGRLEIYKNSTTCNLRNNPINSVDIWYELK